MNPPKSWKEFFDSHAPYYLQNSFAQNTLVEVEFLWEIMGLRPGMSLLDMGCGVGRHSVELASRGILATGVDISSGMLAQAREAASSRGVQVEWVEADATAFVAETPYDAAICLCEGGIGLIGHDEDPVTHDMAILKGIASCLKPGAPFVMTALNGLATIRKLQDADVEAGAFDPATGIAIYRDEWDLPEGTRQFFIKERTFTPPELAAMLHHAGFLVEHIWGGTAGDWGQRPVKLDEIEVMYLCRRRSA